MTDLYTILPQEESLDVPIDRYSSTRQYHFVTYDLADDTYPPGKNKLPIVF